MTKRTLVFTLLSLIFLGCKKEVTEIEKRTQILKSQQWYLYSTQRTTYDVKSILTDDETVIEDCKNKNILKLDQNNIAVLDVKCGGQKKYEGSWQLMDENTMYVEIFMTVNHGTAGIVKFNIGFDKAKIIDLTSSSFTILFEEWYGFGPPGNITRSRTEVRQIFKAVR